jgi:peptidoglycan/xylan/chitin deacetylase (PgdA/CDA1 family)
LPTITPFLDETLLCYSVITMDKKLGRFVVSLDFELFWGMTDATTLEAYGAHIAGERTAIPRMLEYFTKYGIHATWATVGMLMARNKTELLSLLPPHDLRPTYPVARMSTYHYIEHTKIGTDESDDVYHYGPSLVEAILNTPHQELANHTFSHYYAVDGSTNGKHILARDLEAHAQITKTYGVTTSSIVFPRNQVSDRALETLTQHGITAYRGNENHFLYQSRGYAEQSLFIRGLRLLDHYINLSGYHTYGIETMENRSYGIANVAASRFLRPYMKQLSWLEPLRLLRIKRAMTHAARRGEVFHLWWHPHNFGINQAENFKNLEILLEHFKKLQAKYGMQSTSMKELAHTLKNSSYPTPLESPPDELLEPLRK